MEYKNRTLKNVILKASENFKIILITGMRQVGKTTILSRASEKNRKYVTFDNPKDLLLAKDEPEFFLSTYAPPVLIDEVQYAPQIFPYLKMLADRSDKYGIIWMTGSQQFSLMKGVSESLAGRVAIMNLSGFSIYERENKGEMQKPFLPNAVPASVVGRKSLRETFDVIWRGSYPEIVSKDADMWSHFYASYVKTYVERDIRQIMSIGNESDFIKFLSVAAARTGQELNIADIARNVDIAPNTAKAWLSILETSGVVYLLKPYFKNVTRRLIKKPKLYFMDTGLCAYLTSWNTPESLEKGAMSGAFFETFVIAEIIKSYHHNGRFPALYYYRDNMRTEIDLLIEQDGKFYPIEIKKTSNPGKNDVTSFAMFAQNEPLGYGTLICLTDKPRPLTEGANAMSVWDI